MVNKVKDFLKRTLALVISVLTIVGSASPLSTMVTAHADSHDTYYDRKVGVGGYTVSKDGTTENSSSRGVDFVTTWSLDSLSGPAAYCIEPFVEYKASAQDEYLQGYSTVKYSELSTKPSDETAGYAYVGSGYGMGTHKRAAAQILVWRSLGYTVTGPAVNALNNDIAAVKTEYENKKKEGYEFSGTEFGAVQGRSQNLLSMVTATAYRPINYPVTVIKKSDDTKVTEGNPNYSVAGAEFDVTCTYIGNNEAGDLRNYTGPVTKHVTTGADGKATTTFNDFKVRDGVGIDKFKFTATETKEPTGFTRNGNSVSGNGTDGQILTVSNTPKYDGTGVRIYKVSKDGTIINNPKTLEGTQFEVKFYRAKTPMTTVPTGDAAYTWTIKTTKHGTDAKPVYFADVKDPENYVSGEYPKDKNGNFAIPLGVLTIREVKPAAGYTLDTQVVTADGEEVTVDANKTVVYNCLENGNAAKIMYGNQLAQEETHTDTPVRAGFDLVKYDNDENRNYTQGNAPDLTATFVVINNNDFETVSREKDDTPNTVGSDVNNTGYPVTGYGKGETIYSFKTDKEGKFTSNNNLLSSGNYIVKEVVAPEGYTLNGTTEAPLTIEDTQETNGKMYHLTGVIKDRVQRGTFKLKKNDLDLGTNIPQGDNNLSGKYALINKSNHEVMVDFNNDGKIDENETYQPNEVIRDKTKDDNSKKIQTSFVTAADGTYDWGSIDDGKGGTKTHGLPYGHYEVQEVEAPEHYTTEGKTLISFDITKDNEYVDKTQDLLIDPVTHKHVTDPNRAEPDVLANKPTYGKVQLYKHVNKESGSEADDRAEDGAEFLVILDSKVKTLYHGNIQEAWDEIYKYAQDNNLVDSKTKKPDAYLVNGTNFTGSDGRVKLSEHEYYVIKTGTQRNADGDIMNGFGISGDLATGHYDIMQFVSGNANGYDPSDLNKMDEDKEIDIHDNTTTNVEGYRVWTSKKDIENGNRIGVTNDEKLYTLRIIKKDAQTGKTVTYNSASFQVYLDANGNGKLDDEDKKYNSVKSNGDIDYTYYKDGEVRIVDGKVVMTSGKEDYDTFRTYSDNEGKFDKGTFIVDDINNNAEYKGSAVLPLRLKKGHYLIVEQSREGQDFATPAGYVKQSAPLAFEVDGTHYVELKSSTPEDKTTNILEKVYSWFDNATNWITGKKRMDLDNEYYVTEKVANDRVFGELNINKAIEPIPEGVDYTFIDRSKAIMQIKFTLTADEDIIDPADGSVIVKKGELAKYYDHKKQGLGDKSYTTLESFSPKADGSIHIENIPLGKYTLKETSVPQGLVLDPEEYTVEFRQNGKDRTEKVVQTLIQGKRAEENPVVFKVTNYTTKYKFTKTDVGGEEVPGAIMSIVDEKGNAVHTWVSTDKPYYVEGLPVGKYKIHEVVAPKGYVLRVTDIPFEVKNTVYEDNDYKDTRKDGANSGTYQITDKIEIVKGIPNQKFEDKQVISRKKDACGEGLKGAKFEVVDQLTGQTVDSWTSDGKDYAISNLIEGHTYTIKEVEVPKGYVKASDVTFKVDNDYTKNQRYDIVDKQVLISKEDVGGKEVEGAKLSITDKDNNVIDEWTSTKTPHYAEGLEVGQTYTLHEDTSPLGYVKATDVTFTVTDDGVDQKVTMIDTVERFAKYDQDGKLITGADLELVDEKGTTVDKWTSGEKIVDISEENKKKLENGEEVTFTEEDKTYRIVPLEKTEKTDENSKGFDENGKAVDQKQACELKDKINKAEDTKVKVDKDKITGYETIITYKDKDGNEITEYRMIDLNGNETEHMVQGVEAGKKYTVKEVKGIDGYYFDNDQTIQNDGKTDGNPKMTDNKIKYQIAKVDDNGKIVKGVELHLYDITGLKQVSEDEYKKLQDEKAKEAEAKAEADKASETAAEDTKATDEATDAETKETADVAKETAENAEVKDTEATKETANDAEATKETANDAEATKETANDAEIKDAENTEKKDTETKEEVKNVAYTGWVDKDGNAVKPEEIKLPNNGVTTDKPFQLVGTLKADHTYYLEETKYVPGVFKAASVTFVVSHVGKDEFVTVKMYDALTNISVRKTDTKGKALAGAKLEILETKKDENGNVVRDSNGKAVVATDTSGKPVVVYSFTSTADAKGTDISKYVKGDETYILRETEAPTHYEKVTDQEFKVTGNKKLAQVMVVVDRGGVNTGVEAPLREAAIGLVAGGLLILILLKNKKKREEAEAE